MSAGTFPAQLALVALFQGFCHADVQDVLENEHTVFVHRASHYALASGFSDSPLSHCVKDCISA